MKDIEGTVHFILSDSGQVFGGLTFAKYKVFDKSDKKRYQEDDDAFIFQLNKRTIHEKLTDKNTKDGGGFIKHAVIMNGSKLTSLGNNDICIADDCDKNEDSSTLNFG